MSSFISSKPTAKNPAMHYVKDARDGAFAWRATWYDHDGIGARKQTCVPRAILDEVEARKWAIEKIHGKLIENKPDVMVEKLRTISIHDLSLEQLLVKDYAPKEGTCGWNDQALKEACQGDHPSFYLARWWSDKEHTSKREGKWPRQKEKFLPNHIQSREAAFQFIYDWVRTRGNYRRQEARKKSGLTEKQRELRLFNKFEQQGRRCYYCSCPIVWEKKKFNSKVEEHKTPLARLAEGGTDEDANVVASCKECNSRKHSKTEAEFLNDQEYWIRKISSMIKITQTTNTYKPNSLDDYDCDVIITKGEWIGRTGYWDDSDEDGAIVYLVDPTKPNAPIMEREYIILPLECFEVMSKTEQKECPDEITSSSKQITIVPEAFDGESPLPAWATAKIIPTPTHKSEDAT